MVRLEVLLLLGVLRFECSHGQVLFSSLIAQFYPPGGKSQGTCATKSGGKGSYDEVWGIDRAECKERCAWKRICQGYAFSTYSGRASRCQLHKSAISHPVPESQARTSECFAKKQTGPAQGGSGVAAKPSPNYIAAKDPLAQLTKVPPPPPPPPAQPPSSPPSPPPPPFNFCETITFAPSIRDIATYPCLEKVGPGVDLTSCAFTDADLRGANLRGSIIFGVNFNNAQLQCADLEGATVTEAFMNNANFTEAKMAGIAFSGSTDLGRATFSRADLTGATFMETDIKRANFSDAQLFRSSFSVLPESQETIFEGTNLSGTRFHDSRLPRVSFRGADLSGASFEKTDMPLSHFDATTNFARVEFFECQLSNAAMQGAQLQGATFRYTDLSKANIEAASFRSANLDSSDLSYTLARYSDFTMSKLMGTFLYGGDFTSANFNHADLTAAMMSDGGVHAKVSFADFTGAVGISPDTFSATQLHGEHVIGLAPPPAPPPV
eukprot:CAMPEP_0183340374 /NCGR_PEP_ID=MMETSP0164_2-20130417/6944_1 /TAXON_ID=221442 /ORGANISM="Coccolithus pelagicus ssp braarudi, Strain PLY182g" /LENGTH=493 /DNA_ID=CAMNT_0025510495 /DNA_START=254 /DNA_END=1735 /DNA_ORIENTATION=+